MNQPAVGGYIAQKRREKNLTQTQLAQRVGVTGKTVSKWETGRCMPDYSVVEALCRELGITLSELLRGGEEPDAGEPEKLPEAQRAPGRLRWSAGKKRRVIGLVLVAASAAELVLSRCLGGTGAQAVLAGFLTGFCIPKLLLGVYLVCRRPR